MLPDVGPEHETRLFCAGCPGAAGEAGQIQVLPQAGPPAESPDLQAVPGDGPHTAEPARPLPGPEVLRGVERRRQGEVMGASRLYETTEMY